MQQKIKILLICLIFLKFIALNAQDSTAIFIPDTLLTNQVDTLLTDLTTDTLSKTQNSAEVLISKDALEDNIEYDGEDSIIYDIPNKMVYLYGNAFVEQGSMKMEAGYIEFNFNSKEVKAAGVKDTLGNLIQTPIFTDNGTEFRADTMRYNFETKKGKINQLLTQEGEGYLVAKKVKKGEDESLFGANAYYTTCNHEHPHFRIQSKKVKVINKKLIVTGPANLVIDDVPTPLFLPFGIFPIQDGRRSGILLPKYGEAGDQGFFLRDGGFYFGLSPYFDLAIRGDIYSRGRWRLNVASQYKKRYKYSGRLNISYGSSPIGDRITDNYRVTKDLNISWNHSQDAKAHPYRTFSASVSAGTTTYVDNFVGNNLQDLRRNDLQSSINLSRSFPGTPFNVSMTLGHNQNNTNRNIRFTLPSVTFNMNKQFPFKKKIRVGKVKWYENINVAYTMNLRNTVSTIDSVLFTRATRDKFVNGLKHNVPINLGTFKLFKYITFAPTIRYNESWYLKTIDKRYQDTLYVESINDEGAFITDTLYNQILIDTIGGFRAARFFNGGFSMNTRLYGMLQFNKGKIKTIRHVMNPSINFTVRPDFGASFWDYYRELYDENGDLVERFSIFQSGLNIFDRPPDGLQALLTFNLSNNIEMKLRTPKDTAETEKKVKIFESLNLSGIGYDFARDSLNWNSFSINATTTLFKKIRLNFTSRFDPYMRENGQVVNKLHITEGRKIADLRTATFRVNGSFDAKRRTNEIPEDNLRGTEEERQDILYFLNDYTDFNIPFKLTWSYNLTLSKSYDSTLERDKLNKTQRLDLGIETNLTEKWRVNVRGGYDFEDKKIAIASLDVYRDLHCWEMSFNWIPQGTWRRYEFQINVRSSILQDLKLTRTRQQIDNFDF